jgi:hypothetical protein
MKRTPSHIVAAALTSKPAAAFRIPSCSTILSIAETLLTHLRHSAAPDVLQLRPLPVSFPTMASVTMCSRIAAAGTRFPDVGGLNGAFRGLSVTARPAVSATFRPAAATTRRNARLEVQVRSHHTCVAPHFA